MQNFHSRTSSQSLNSQQNMTPRTTSQFLGDTTGKRILKKVKAHKYNRNMSKSHKDLTPLNGANNALIGQGNNLFLSINNLAVEQIEFPNKIFDSALSPKYHNATYNHSMQTNIANRKMNHAHHQSNSFIKATGRKQTFQQ